METKIDQTRVTLLSNNLELSEEEEYRPYLEFTNRVCYYDDPNGNGVALPYNQDSYEYAQTLVNQPIVAKYCVDEQGQPNLRDHCVSKDEKGKYRFNTESVGAVTEVWIEDSEVTTYAGETKTLKCLYAKGRIWKRHENYVSAIQRLFDEHKLHNSWEISSSSHHMSDGVKFLDEYVFEANCFLGTGDGITPAYGESAEVFELSSEQQDTELLVASLLSEDIKNSENGVDNMEEIKVTDSQTDVSALTMWDIYEKLEACLREKNFRGHISYVFPEEHIVLAKGFDTPELEFVKYQYEITEDRVEIDDGEKVELVVSPLNFSAVIAERDEKIASLESENEALKQSVSELSEYKAQKDAEEAARAEEQLAAQRAELRAYAENSGVFTPDELESESISAMIDAVDTSSIKAIVADRLLEKLSTATVATPVVANVSSMITVAAPANDNAVEQVRKYINR